MAALRHRGRCAGRGGSGVHAPRAAALTANRSFRNFSGRLSTLVAPVPHRARHWSRRTDLHIATNQPNRIVFRSRTREGLEMNDDAEAPGSRDDLQSTLESFQQTLRGQIDDRRQTIATVAVVVAVGMAAVAYLLGRRSGRRKSAIIDIRRL